MLNNVTNITGVSFQCNDVTESKSRRLSRAWSKTLIWPRGRGVSRYVTWRCVTLRHASRGWGRWTLPLTYYLSRVTIVNCNVCDKNVLQSHNRACWRHGRLQCHCLLSVRHLESSASIQDCGLQLWLRNWGYRSEVWREILEFDKHNTNFCAQTHNSILTKIGEERFATRFQFWIVSLRFYGTRRIIVLKKVPS